MKSEYSTSIDLSTLDLADGIYTVKAFVWNNFDNMNPYANSYVEKTLTVSGGVATLSE